jgi:hypothetical protein
LAQVFNACADHIFIREVEQLHGGRVGNDCAAIYIEYDHAVGNAFQDGIAPAGLDPFPAERIGQFLRAFLDQVVQVGIDLPQVMQGSSRLREASQEVSASMKKPIMMMKFGAVPGRPGYLPRRLSHSQ